MKLPRCTRKRLKPHSPEDTSSTRRHTTSTGPIKILNGSDESALGIVGAASTGPRGHPRPGLDLCDRLICIIAHQLWSGWKQALVVVTPETVVRWHQTGFHLYWKLISRVGKPVGRRPTSKEVQELIFQMVAENPTWGRRGCLGNSS